MSLKYRCPQCGRKYVDFGFAMSVHVTGKYGGDGSDACAPAGSIARKQYNETYDWDLTTYPPTPKVSA